MFAVAFLEDRQVAREAIERVTLVISELTTNALSAAPDDPYELTLARVGATTSVSVANPGDTSDVPEQATWRPDDVLAARGRGLSIVDAISATVSVTGRPNGWVEITAVIVDGPAT